MSHNNSFFFLFSVSPQMRALAPPPGAQRSVAGPLLPMRGGGGGGGGVSSTRCHAAPPPQFTLGPTNPLSFSRLVALAPAPDFRAAATLATLPWADPPDGHVTVRITYAGVNGGCETFRVRGEPGTAFAKNARASAAEPISLGAEGVGLVAAVGPGVTSLAVGDAVAVSSANAFAEFVTAPAARCARLPPGLGGASPAAVALTLSGLTAAVALGTCGVAAGQAGLSPADAVLVTAASGGTGHLAAQLAAASGAAVFATTGGPAKATALRALLAPWPRARVIDYTAEDVEDVLRRECPAPGLTVAYEGVGGAARDAAIAALAPGGRVLAVGHISEYPNAAPPRLGAAARGAPAQPGARPLPPAHDTFWGGREVDLGEGRTLYGNVWGGADALGVARARRAVFSAYAQGTLRVLIDGASGEVDTPYVGLGAAADGVERLMGGESVGKVVLRVWR